jgi:hypothetical protein
MLLNVSAMITTEKPVQRKRLYGIKWSLLDSREQTIYLMACRASFFVAKAALLVLAVTGGTTAWGRTENQPAAPDLHTCRYSDQVYESDASLMRGNPPTRFRLMPSRYMQFMQAARGHNCTGTATVAFTGHKYVQTGVGDDPGIAVMVSTLSSLFGMSLADTFDLVIFMVIFSGVLIGYAGFWRLYPQPRARWIGAAVFLCIGLAEVKVSDVYIFQSSPLVAGIPWVLHFGLGRKPFALNTSAVLLAFCCSWCSLVRLGANLICMAFLITLFIARRHVQRILLPLLLIFLACVPSILFTRYLVTRRNAILAAIGETASGINRHMVWHSIYIGFGFVPNSEVPAYNDSVAMDKVSSINPAALSGSAEYEAILRREVLNLAKCRPMLVIENLALKAGIVIFWTCVLLFPSRRFLFADRDVLWLDAAFVVAIGVSAMSAILVVPRPSYLLTFLCLTFLYTSVKFCGARFPSPVMKTPVG